MDRYPREYTPSKYFFAKEGQKTFMHDTKLPSLPVPDLHTTLKKYLDSVEPHLTSDEMCQTREVVTKFYKNEGKKLQALLLERAKQKRNWLDDWWLSYAYLKLRFPIAPLMNVCGMGPYIYHLWPPMYGTRISRSALATYFQLKHWQSLRREELAIDSGKAGKEPWSMNQFRRLYNCCRVPGLDEDSLVIDFKTVSEGPVPTHMVVLCNKRIYKLETMSPDGKLHTPPELEAAFTLIQSIADKNGPGIGLSTLTSEERTTFYHIRQHMISLSEQNRINFETIQSAVFSSGYVNESPGDMTQMANEGLLGKPGNCWYDKSYSALWFENGTTVSNCDHAPMDAMTSVNVCYYIDCTLRECEGRWQGDKSIKAIPKFSELVFTVDQKVMDAIKDAEEKYMSIVRNVEIINPEFGYFGKNLLRKYKIHPDTFAQVCLQYGYYKLHGRPAPTYETATTRKFYHGRTETVKSCTNEALMFSKAMLDPESSDSHKLRLFKIAMDKHLSTMRECMEGQGIDRHLLGLKILAIENGLPVPDLYTDPAYEKSGGNGNYVLSTSFVGFTSVHGGVAPMCKNGYGFFYRMGGERMVLYISSWRSDEDTSAMKLYNSVKDVMCEMMALIQSSAQSLL